MIIVCKINARQQLILCPKNVRLLGLKFCLIYIGTNEVIVLKLRNPSILLGGFAVINFNKPGSEFLVFMDLYTASINE